MYYFLRCLLGKVDDYAVDFGHSAIDPNKGLWLKEDENNGVTVWYKLHTPHIWQIKQVKNDAELIRDFIKLSDCLLHLYKDKVLSFPKNSVKSICNKTIGELHVICEKKFDLAFVKKEAVFVFDQLNAAIDMRASKLLHEGLLPPGMHV